MKKDKGVTLIALVITTVVLLIILGIGFRAKIGMKDQVYNAEDDALKAQLSGIQHAVLETYIKYKQTRNESVLIGTEETWMDSEAYLQEINEESGESITLKANEDDYESAENKYYSVSSEDLEKLGFEKDKDTYIVNYETGEVFNITKKVTNKKEALYIYVLDKSKQ